ncbi:ABC transporter permease [Microlunatus sp. Gsoil 973]|jgi:fructose transport system permease protein|uniref:ABC transporter permease n=1 Tax=Microlunatus sp. Gsoil 973 TaxID=2672569 RepID=UPI0012B44B1D|nr:ABC transporter permease [Microlunatus sp. Gsoil 973]QGN33111.1 ABC transporter permease [Microlunatus sp. Gsoil 973]
MTTQVENPASVEDLLSRRRSPLERIQHLLHGSPALSPLIVLIVAIIVFGIVSEGFLRPQALSLLVQQMAVVGALAAGQTLIILTAGVDLSIGMAMVLASLVMAKLSFDGVPGVIALLIGFAVAVATGLLNGFLVTRINLPPFIVTLGTFSIFTAISLLYAQGQTVTLNPDAFLLVTGTSLRLGPVSVTWGVLLMLLLFLVLGFALRTSAWGRHLYATGDDREAAQLAGIATRRVLFSAYLVAGICVGVAAWIVCGRVGGADPNAGLNYNLLSITAVVIGGTSLFGGRGSVVGTLIGALIVQTFNSGLALAGVDPNYQVLATGILVILAVAIDQWIRRVKG